MDSSSADLSDDRRHALAVRLTALLERRAGAVVIAFLLLTVVCTVLATRLRIDQELRRLLPDDFPSVVGIDRLGDEVGNQADLYLSIRSPSREANVAFGNALEKKLADNPDVRFAIFRRDRAFFDHHALLYADLGDLLELRRKVILRIRDEVRKEAFSGFSLLGDKDAKKDSAAESLGLTKEEIEQRYGGNAEFHEYYETDDGRLMAMRVRPRAPPTDVEFARALMTSIRAAIDELAPTSFHPELDVRFEGSYSTIDKRVKSFRGEVIGGSSAILAILMGSIALYFRSWRSALIVFVPLVGAIVVSLAFAALAYGFLNLVSAFIFAILLGLGIDFAIVLLSRYRDERLRGLDRTHALEVTLSTTAPATLFGGASTALGFGVLAIADFQGFAQFGVVATVGVFSALLASMIVMPAMLILLDRVRPWNPPPRRRRSTDVKIDSRNPRWFLAAVLVVIAACGWVAWSVRHASDLEFEYDFDKLGPAKKSTQTGPGYRDAIGPARTVAPAVAVGKDTADAESMYRQLAAIRSLTPEEAAAFDPAALAKPVPRAPWPVPPDEPEPIEAPPAGGGDDDDWDEEPTDDEEAPPKQEAPAGERDELDEFGDDDLDDPKFTALEQQVVLRPRIAPATLDMLSRYEPGRIAELADLMNDVTALSAFVPEGQADKLAVIADIRARIDAKRGSLTDKTRKDIDEWYHHLEVTMPVTADTLPDWVRLQFADSKGELGRFVVVWTKGSKTDYRNVKRVHDAYGSLLAPSGEVELAADFFVIPEVYEAIRTDGPMVVALSFCVMLTTSIATFRSLSAGAGAALMVPFSLISLLGLMVTLGWKLNFFNVIAMPLLVGMGEDASLHIIARYREEGRDGLALAVRETGGAIFMTAWTTICGFAAILWADHRGLQSLAWVAVIGVCLVFATSVLLLPSLIVVVDRLRRR
jgi:predicted RND superfamily exporter protein